jgi:hypothetical protein
MTTASEKIARAREVENIRHAQNSAEHVAGTAVVISKGFDVRHGRDGCERPEEYRGLYVIATS